MIQAVLKKNDKFAYGLIAVLSVVVFLVVLSLGKFKLYSIAPNAQLGFDPHIFARINGVLNSLVSVLLILGLVLVWQRKYALHRTVMLSAFAVSSLFLVSYICHHFLTYDTHFGGQSSLHIFGNFNIPVRYIYFPILVTHIILAATVLPFILLTTYRGLTADFKEHKLIARITYPIWLYVSVTGVIVYLMISPYYTAL